jgi:hypothetical protein
MENALSRFVSPSNSGLNCDFARDRLRERLKQLRNLVVVEIMDTVLATYLMQDSDLAEDGPPQHEFVLH